MGVTFTEMPVENSFSFPAALQSSRAAFVHLSFRLFLILSPAPLLPSFFTSYYFISSFVFLSTFAVFHLFSLFVKNGETWEEILVLSQCIHPATAVTEFFITGVSVLRELLDTCA